MGIKGRAYRVHDDDLEAVELEVTINAKNTNAMDLDAVKKSMQAKMKTRLGFNQLASDDLVPIPNHR